MIFSLGKARGGERPVESQTLERWRSLAESQAYEFESVKIIESERINEGAIPLTNCGAGEQREDKPFTFDLAEEATVRAGEPAKPTPKHGGSRTDGSPIEAEVRKISPVIPISAKVAATERRVLDFDEDLRRRFGANLRSALGPGTVIEGKFSFDTPVRIDGSMNGEVISSSALIVGPQATVAGKVRVGSIIIAGEVTGEIEATDLVEIRSGGRYEGPIHAARVVIEDGAVFNGTCQMS